jgi:hypothetical protein
MGLVKLNIFIAPLLATTGGFGQSPEGLRKGDKGGFLSPLDCYWGARNGHEDPTLAGHLF